MLSEGLSRKGHFVVVIAEAQARAVGAGGYNFTQWRPLSGAIQAMKQSDVVLMMNVSLPGILAVVLSGRPLVIAHHGVYGGVGIRERALSFIKRAITFFSTNICVSEFVARCIHGDALVVRNALADEFQGVEIGFIEASRFVFAGRLVHGKGAHLCIEALARASAETPTPRLTIIGDGPELSNLKQLAELLQVNDRVTFVGSLQGAALVSELQRHHCALVPSLQPEGYGLAVLEGLACCEMVISSDKGALPETIAGYGMTCKADPDEIWSAMLAVMNRTDAERRIERRSSTLTRLDYLTSLRSEQMIDGYERVLLRRCANRDDRVR
jgi:glycosyltransferase involved in cell wall biosynthesis